MKKLVTGAIVAAALGVGMPALAGYCEDVFDECYYRALMETDERARDARMNECFVEYEMCVAQPAVSRQDG
ncbi:hypothetical protein ACN47A_01240 [Myxococcus fulvus]|uniref:hypothetical protein n=1 Tax=Myxococcus fulvus TaxID=33 RepID=UPI003B99338E